MVSRVLRPDAAVVLYDLGFCALVHRIRDHAINPSVPLPCDSSRRDFAAVVLAQILQDVLVQLVPVVRVDGWKTCRESSPCSSFNCCSTVCPVCQSRSRLVGEAPRSRLYSTKALSSATLLTVDVATGVSPSSSRSKASEALHLDSATSSRSLAVAAGSRATLACWSVPLTPGGTAIAPTIVLLLPDSSPDLSTWKVKREAEKKKGKMQKSEFIELKLREWMCSCICNCRGRRSDEWYFLERRVA